MSVAYPAEIPVEPLTKRFEKAAGKTVGSFSVSSKLQVKANGLFLDVLEEDNRQFCDKRARYNALLADFRHP